MRTPEDSAAYRTSAAFRSYSGEEKDFDYG